MEVDRTMHGTLVRQGVGKHKCAACEIELKPGDKITHTLDMRFIWHTSCYLMARRDGAH